MCTFRNACHVRINSLIIEKYKSKVSLNGDVLIINSISYTVNDLLDVPTELQPLLFSERSNDKYTVFGGLFSGFNPLSNWYPCDISFKGHCFKSLEQGYQYAKAVYAKDTASARRLLYTSYPRAAKDLGSKVSGLGNTKWDTDKYGIMADLAKIKFSSNPELKIALLKTGNTILVESGRDVHYACGLPITSKDIFSPVKWSGKNMLGKILSDVRDSIQNVE